MKREKIIYGSVAAVLTLLFVVSLVFFAIEGNTYWLMVTFLAILLIGRPLNYWYDRQMEKKNPLNFRRVRSALYYAVSKNEGTKDEFVAERGEEMYNHFLSIGYIHEPHFNTGSGSIKWEVTQLAINRKESMYR